jgi:hypothetical protein
MMNYIFHNVISKHAQKGTIICVYMDDIAIAMSSTKDVHTEAVADVLQVTLDHDLYFKPEKCTFGMPSINYLGVILEKGVTHMDPVKTASIKNWPAPKTVKDVQSCLGFCNFYQTFIKGFATHS